MPRQLSQTTINEYLPIIRSIQADLDARLQSPSFENSPIFRTAENTLGYKYSFPALAHVLSIICGWIEETGITTGKIQDAYCFVKTNDTGLWSRMYELIEENISTYLEDKTPSKSLKTKENGGTVIKLPKGAVWEEIELRFKDAHTVNILRKGTLICTVDNEQLGLGARNTKNKSPNKSWKLLSLLAIAAGHGAQKAPVKSLFIGPLKTSEAGCDQIKGRLSKRLKQAFGISDDPFCPYNRKDGYKTKFSLKPESVLMGNGVPHASGGRLYDEKVGGILEGMDD